MSAIKKSDKRITKKESAKRSARIVAFEERFKRDNGASPTIAELMEGTSFSRSVCQTWRRNNPKEPRAKMVKPKNMAEQIASGKVPRSVDNKLYHLISKKNQNKNFVNPEVFCKFAGYSYGTFKKLQGDEAYFRQTDEEGNLNLVAAMDDLRHLKGKSSPDQLSKEKLELEFLKVKLGKEKGELINRSLLRILLTEVARNSGNIVDNYVPTVLKNLPLEIDNEARDKLIVVLNESLRTMKSKLESLPHLPSHSLFDDETND